MQKTFIDLHYPYNYPQTIKTIFLKNNPLVKSLSKKQHFIQMSKREQGHGWPTEPLMFQEDTFV